MGLDLVEDLNLKRSCYLFADDEKFGPQLEIPWAFVTHVRIRAASSEKGIDYYIQIYDLHINLWLQ